MAVVAVVPGPPSVGGNNFGISIGKLQIHATWWGPSIKCGLHTRLTTAIWHWQWKISRRRHNTNKTFETCADVRHKNYAEPRPAKFEKKKQTETSSKQNKNQCNHVCLCVWLPICILIERHKVHESRDKTKDINAKVLWSGFIRECVSCVCNAL